MAGGYNLKFHETFDKKGKKKKDGHTPHQHMEITVDDDYDEPDAYSNEDSDGSAS